MMFDGSGFRFDTKQDENDRLRTAVKELQKIIDRMVSSDLEVQKVRKEFADAKKQLENQPPPESWLRAHGYLEDHE